MSDELTSTSGGESFAELFEQSANKAKEGQVTKGRVLAIDDDQVQVDVGSKSEGLIDTWEFMDEDGTLLVKPGDVVDVLIEEAEDLGRDQRRPTRATRPWRARSSPA